MPDQFALARLDALEAARPAGRPLFLFFPTTSTHAPFGPIAPYQPDWPQLVSPHPYAEPELSAALAREPDYLDLAPSYVNAVAYSLATLGGYLRQHPTAIWSWWWSAITSRPPWWRARARRGTCRCTSWPAAPRCWTRCWREGFSGGATPGRRSIGPMHALLPTLLESFGSPPARVAAR